MSEQQVFAQPGASEWIELAPGNRRRVLIHTPELMQVEFGFDKGHGERMDRELGKDRRFRQQGIDAVGFGAFKIVAAEQIARQMRRQRRAEFSDAVGRKNAFEDQVTAAVEHFPEGGE